MVSELLFRHLLGARPHRPCVNYSADYMVSFRATTIENGTFVKIRRGDGLLKGRLLLFILKTCAGAVRCA